MAAAEQEVVAAAEQEVVAAVAEEEEEAPAVAVVPAVGVSAFVCHCPAVR